MLQLAEMMKRNSHWRKEIIEHVKLRTGVDNNKVDNDINIQNIESGRYHVTEDKLLPHTHDYISLIRIPIKYKPRGNTLKKYVSLNS